MNLTKQMMQNKKADAKSNNLATVTSQKGLKDAKVSEKKCRATSYQFALGGNSKSPLANKTHSVPKDCYEEKNHSNSNF